MAEKCCDTASKCEQIANQSDCCNVAEELLALADEAWHELLKEKIKAEIEKTAGDKMNKLAQIVSTANHDKWTHLITGKVKCEEYKQTIKNFFANK